MVRSRAVGIYEGKRSSPKTGIGKHELVERLHRRFEEEDITIPFPIRTLDVPDPFRVREEPSGEERTAG